MSRKTSILRSRSNHLPRMYLMRPNGESPETLNVERSSRVRTRTLPAGWSISYPCIRPLRLDSLSGTTDFRLWRSSIGCISTRSTMELLFSPTHTV